MSKQRPRLLLPPHGLSLDESQLQWLRKHFDIVEGNPSEHLGAAALPPSGGAFQRLYERAAELVMLDPSTVRELNAVERIEHLERNVSGIVREELDQDHFEVRLLNQQTSQLELVMAVGIDPLGIGQQLYARAEENGISGYVALSGETYLCTDVEQDPRYMTGIENAGSSLTLPLKIGKRIIGVLNIESEQVDAFSPQDVSKAQVLASFLALALNQLNLLVVERAATGERLLETLAEEFEPSLDSIAEASEALRAGGDAATGPACDRIERAVGQIRGHLDPRHAVPGSLLGIERIVGQTSRIPSLEGKRVLIIDDDDRIRENITRILSCVGCEVVSCPTGRAALEELDSRRPPIDAVISDVRLPDLTGYEVFRQAQEQYSVPVILMTGFGYDPHHSVVRASQEGLQSILFKPFKAKQLLDELQRAFEANEAAP